MTSNVFVPFPKGRPKPAPLVGEAKAREDVANIELEIRCARRDGDVEYVDMLKKGLDRARADFVREYGHEP